VGCCTAHSNTSHEDLLKVETKRKKTVCLVRLEPQVLEKKFSHREIDFIVHFISVHFIQFLYGYNLRYRNRFPGVLFMIERTITNN
jgi:hypothetical protein